MAAFIPFPDKFHLAHEFMKDSHPIEASHCALSTEHRLAFYSLQMQALHGQNNTAAPSRWSVTERAKWDAWNSLAKMSQLEAMVFYVQLVEKEVSADWLEKVKPPPEPEPEPEPPQEAPQVKEEEAPTLEYISGKSRAKPDTEEAAWTALQEAWKDLDTTLTLLKADSEAVAELKDALNAERHASDILRQQNSMLQGQLQTLLHQQAQAAQGKLHPKRVVAAKATARANGEPTFAPTQCNPRSPDSGSVDNEPSPLQNSEPSSPNTALESQRPSPS
jgi:acyl-CoA-binding protein